MNLGIFKKIFRIEILNRLARLLKYKIWSLKHLKLYDDNKNNIFLIYTMGKVGSSSIYETLKSKLAYNQIYHIHFLTKENMYWRDQFKNNKSASIVERYVRKRVSNNKNKKKLKVITIVRDITSRDLSMIFQNYDSFFEKNESINNKKIEDIFEKQNQDLSIRWFENEFQKYLNIDIYKLAFNKDMGYSIYEFENIDLLVLKLEKLNYCYKDALKKFTNIEFNKLIKVNEAGNKKIAKLYSETKKNIRISSKKLALNYESKYMNNFYTKDEILKLKNKWKIKKI